MEGRVKYRERDRLRSHSQDGYNCWVYDRLQPGVRNSILISQIGGRGPKHLGHLLLLPQGHYQGAGSELELPGLKPALLWDAGDTGRSLVHCTTTPALKLSGF